MHTPVIFHPEFQISNRPYTVHGVIKAESGVPTVIPYDGTEANYLAQKRKDLMVLTNKGKRQSIKVVEIPPLMNHSCCSDLSTRSNDVPEIEASCVVTPGPFYTH
ncbi:hypothetical protein BC833DRAFT_623418 [Globomyces pollinis-pini]|nr:hypothetical protein BC833DRAFT_623418 [Globomyces pollinis-pini]